MPPTMTFNSYTLSTGDDSDPESKIIAVARDDDDGCVARILFPRPKTHSWSLRTNGGAYITRALTLRIAELTGQSHRQRPTCHSRNGVMTGRKHDTTRARCVGGQPWRSWVSSRCGVS